jgi:ATP-dependent helicase HrpA
MPEQQEGAGRSLNISYPPELPVAERRDDIAAAIAAHQVVIVAGETGSGKTTQIPKICLELGRGQTRLIGHTQPRRLAARTVATRIAQELGVEVGGLVGYQVRFGDHVGNATAVKLMTDGILLNEMQRDRLLRHYDTLIIDEAHERSLNIDFILGYLKRILARRPDLKVIITSATIDVESFSQHFDGAPIIEVSGRTYPVDTHYLGAQVDADTADVESELSRIATLVEQIERGKFGPRGDVLVFLPGEREIREQARALRGLERVEVLPLYARLGQGEQQRVFNSGRGGAGLRVVLATNVAETSVTVPGIRYVIDPGVARISRYSHRSKLQRLPVEAISQASANQRKGRCGRVGPGVCLRLYSEEDFNGRAEFTEPEIQRTNLAAVVLQMLALGLGEVEKFPFIDPPDGRLVRDGYKVLEELGAVSAQGKLTGLGKRLARLPVDPRLGRMLLQAGREHCLAQVLVIVSALSVQDPRERPADRQAQADQMHARFRHERSDFMAWLKLWAYYEEQRQVLTQSKLRKLCQREYLSFIRMREWRAVHSQLTIACRQQQLRPAALLTEKENYRGIHRSLLGGLLSNIAQQHEGREYLGSRNRKMQIFPGSSQARKKPAWIVAAEIVETSRVFAREVAAIDPRWALDLNPNLLKHHYSEPRWRARTGQVMANHRVTLYGLTLLDKDAVHYGPIAPAESRALMISQGLVAGQFNRFPDFLKHNRALVRDLEALEARTRRRDILVEDAVLFAFYDERLPQELYTASGLQSWLKKNRAASASLTMEREMLIARDPGLGVEEQFPQTLQVQDLSFRLSYEFEHGHAADGVSVTVPVALLNRAPRYLFDWLVPGLLREKCIALVKGLPKEKRKQLVPVPDVVERALAVMTPSDTDLLVTLAATLAEQAGVRLSREDFAAVVLDDYYRMNVRVVDERGRLLEQGRDLAALIERYREDTRVSVSFGDAQSPAREGLTRWDFDSLPERFQFRQAGIDILSWPALEDRGDSVAIVLCDYASQAALTHRDGVLRLARLSSMQKVKYLRKQCLRGNESQLILAAVERDRTALVDDLIDAAYVQALALDAQLPREQSAFEACLQRAQPALVECAQLLERNLLVSLHTLGAVRRAMQRWDAHSFADTRADIAEQLAALLAPGFMRDTPAYWLQQFPRYMNALQHRVERLTGQYPKDQRNLALLAQAREPLAQVLRERPDVLRLSAALADYRWMLEEFRVSLFAQSLRTVKPVSSKRLQEQWQKAEDWLLNNPV